MTVERTPEQLLAEQNELIGKLGPIADQLAAKADLTADRVEQLTTEQNRIAEQVEQLETERLAKVNAAKADSALEQIEELRRRFLGAQRTPSKAGVVGPGHGTGEPESDLNFYAAVAMARSRDAEAQAIGKAALNAMGSEWQEGEGKATLGETDANGGFLIPVTQARPIIETATAENPFRRIMNVVEGINSLTIPQPYEGTAPARAVVAPWGDTKENVNFTVANYSATMYTLARIIDVGNQFLRLSRGAAERLVRSKLARAFALGEIYYILSGDGTGEPKGLITSLDASSATYTSTFSSPSDSTVAGSVAAAIATAAGDLANRDRTADAVAMNAGDFWRMLRQGSNEAGFWFNTNTGALGINAGRGELFSPWGIPVVATSAIASDRLIVGEFRSADLYFGQGYRVDVSSEAGDRWDKNLTGFRGEEEMAFNADPFVASGLFQQVTNAVS